MKSSPLFLLQTVGLSEFQIQPKPIHGVIFLVGVAVFVFTIVYLNKSKKIKNNAVFTTGTIDKAELGAIAVKGLGKIARKYGFDAAEQKALAKALHSSGLDIPSVFNSSGGSYSMDDIDSGFSRMIAALSREDDTEQIIARVFSARNKIEYYFLANENSSGEDARPRRHRRIKTNIPASFYLVLVVEAREGLKKVKKLSLDNNKLSGNILDLSASGCAISTRNSVKVGARIKVEFKLGKSSSSALAQIVRINKSASENVLHAHFAKVPVKTLNAINAFVYNYRDI